MKKTVNVEIMGQTFTVSSDAEEGYVRKVAEYVDGKIREVLKTGRPVAKSSVAMLAALNIALDEMERDGTLAALRVKWFGEAAR